MRASSTAWTAIMTSAAGRDDPRLRVTPPGLPQDQHRGHDQQRQQPQPARRAAGEDQPEVRPQTDEPGQRDMGELIGAERPEIGREKNVHRNWMANAAARWPVHVAHPRRDGAARGELVDPVGAGERVDRESESQEAEPEVLGLFAAAAEEQEVMQEHEAKERRQHEQRNLAQQVALQPARTRSARAGCPPSVRTALTGALFGS